MTGSGWASPSGDPEPDEPVQPAGPPGPPVSADFPLSADPDPAPPYYQPLPGGAQGWGTPALPPGSAPPPPVFPGPGGFVPGWSEVKPGVAPLRPLTTGELLDASFTTIRRYPRALLLPGAVLSIVETLLVLLIQASTNRQGNPGGGAGVAGLVATILIGIVSSLAGVLLAAIAAAVVQRGILGQPATLAEAWAAVRPRAWAIIGASVLSAIIWLLATCLLILPGVYFYIALHFTSVVLVIEGGTVRSSIRRSRRLVKGSWWRTFGLVLLVSFIAGVVGTVVSAPFAAKSIGSVLSGSNDVSLGTQALADIGRLLAGIVTVPFTSAAIALIYIDRRMRDEGLDVALRQAAGA